MQSLVNLAGTALQNAVNASQFDVRSSRGFYESYFLRANHKSSPQAFWIRYTIFSPKGNLAGAEGQLWAVYFDARSSTRIAVKQSLPLDSCSFSKTGLLVRIGESSLDQGSLHGSARDGVNQVSWNLSYAGDESPAFLLPLPFYSRGFPKAKVLTGIPLADFLGAIRVNDNAIEIDSWRGSQNHNWGTKHTDRYAWGQVAGFDSESEAFLECSTAKLRIGPLWTPWLTSLVLRLPGREIRLNSLRQAIRNSGHYRRLEWHIDCIQGPMRVSVSFSAPSDRFVELDYNDPPGGSRICWNSKVATCIVRVEEAGRPPVVLKSQCRAAFEILAHPDDVLSQ